MNITEGDNVKLECNASPTSIFPVDEQPVFKITWYINDEEITEENRLIITNSDSLLIITGIKASDRNLSCRVRIDGSLVSATQHLQLNISKPSPISYGMIS